jgi:hypothetical protein
MITTRESINYQFSLIFGYSSPNDLIVGDVIGPGKLTSKKVKDLAKEVIKFLRMYNAILRDYSGSELFSIEFDLYNYDQEDAQLKIYPKSMILIPGKFKDCESLVLALKPETGYLDTHKARNSINNISKLFFEVEEFTDRPELDDLGKEKISQKFSNRFSQKLYGELLEDKWNKKLIGLSTSLPTDRELLNSYADITSDIEILWHKWPHEINILNTQFKKRKTSIDEDYAVDHLKYTISEPSANFIIENTLKLGTNLVNLSNTGTIDETQDAIISFLINRIENNIAKIQELHDGNWLIEYLDKFLSEIESYLNRFLEYSSSFLSTGEIGSLKELLDKYLIFIQEKGKINNEDFEEICNISITSINQTIVEKTELRAIELTSMINYLSLIIKNSIKLLKTSLPNYLTYRRLRTLIQDFIDKLKEEFNKEQKPAQVLGYRIIDMFHFFLLNQLEITPILSIKEQKYDEPAVFNEYKELVKTNLETFYKGIKLNISDLVSFAEIMMEKDKTPIKTHIEKFKLFSNELHYLLSYILRYSTINRYLKDEPDKEITDPVTFANRFHRFLEKKIGGIDLFWKSYILEWITDYAKKFFNQEIQKPWTLKEVFEDFIGYVEEREFKEQKPDNFLDFLDSYIAKLTNEVEKTYSVDFIKQYEFCIGIKSEFPKYVKTKMENTINSIDLETEKVTPINLLSIGDEETYYEYLKEKDLKYFSKLIPRPLSLILKHNLTPEERELFNADFFHVLSFRFRGHNNLKIDVADNFKEVYREWIKDL